MHVCLFLRYYWLQIYCQLAENIIQNGWYILRYQHSLNVDPPVVQLEYCWRIGSVRWLLMPWLLASLGYQRPWYFVGLMGLCLPWGRISTTCLISVWLNVSKCQYMLVFPQYNSKLQWANPLTGGTAWMATDVLVLKHQGISTHSTDYTFIGHVSYKNITL